MSKLLSQEKLSFLDRRRQEKIIRRLLTIDKREWLEIGHMLNSWQWHRRFLDLIPRWWPKRPKKWFVFIHPITQIIEQEFGKRAELEYHNVHRGRMTRKEFAYWFDHVHTDDLSDRNKEAATQYYSRVMFMEEIEWWRDDIFEKIKTALADQLTDNQQLLTKDITV